MHVWRLLFFCILALSGASCAWSQQADKVLYTYRNWTVQEGLPQVSVTAIVQTPDGYLWLGTNGGLVRFDGVQFKVYNTANTPAIQSNRIRALAIDQQGRLWIGAEGYIIWRTEEGFQAMRTPEGNNVDLLFADADGSMWVGMETVLGHFDTSLAYREVHRFEDLNPITTIYRDEAGPLWVGTLSRVYQLDGETLVPDRLLGGILMEEPVYVILSTGPDAYWVRTRSKVLHIEKAHATVALAEENDNEISQDILIADRKGNLWAHKSGGLYFIERAGHTFAPARLIENLPEIGSLFEDREGNLWVGSGTKGLFRFTPKQVRTLPLPAGRTRRSMQAIVEAHDGSMWMADGCRVSRWQKGQMVNSWPGAEAMQGCAWSLGEDADGILWIGTWGGGLYQWLDGRIRKVEADFVNHNTVVLVIHEDRRGALWLGMLKHLVRVDPDGSYQIFTTANGLPHNDVRHIYEAPNGDLWMGTPGGMVHISGDTWTSYTTEDGLSHNHVRAIYEDSEGIIWVGTYGGGLNRLKDGHFTPYTMADGLGDDTISRIFEDEHGRLWMSGNQGISSIAKAQLHAFAEGEVARLNPVLYNEAHGMPHRETNGGFQPAGWQRTNGEMWFPTQAGVAIIDLEALQTNKVPPPVQIQEVRVDGMVQDARGSLVLEASSHNIEIDYAGLSFVDPEQVQYRYRLLGVEDQWQNVGSRRTAYFTKLKSGTYTFQVSAQNNDGVWNSEGTRLSILIPTPWWQTRGAYVSYMLVGLLAVWSYVQVRTRTSEHRRAETEALLAERTQELREQSEKLQALDAAKSRFFANISHEFRTPLTLSLGPLEDVLNERHGPVTEETRQQIDLALLNNRRLLRLVNQLLDVARVNADKLVLQVRPLDLTDFLATLAQAFEPLATRKEILFATAFPPAPVLVYADASQLEKGVLNLLSNAFKFTPEQGRVLLALRTSETDVCIEVKDSGPGIPADQISLIFDRFHQVEVDAYRHQVGTGIGLALTKELIDLHGGRIEVESVEGWGTTFRVFLRYGKAHFADTPHEVVETSTELLPKREVALPAAMETPKGEEEEDADELLEDRTTVLIVEDNADIRAFLRGHLGERYRVVEADNGAEGLQQARALSPDLILSDVMMPEMDGYELCQALKQDPELDFIPVILLTARAETEDRLAGLGQGADDYLTKPFNVEELKARMHNLIIQRQRLRARFNEAETPPVPISEMQSSDAAFLEGVQAAVEAHMADPSFNVTALADAVAMDRTHLYRRLKALSGVSPTQYMRTMRLEQGARLLEAQAGTVSEIAYGVGFQSVPYFTTSFRKQYGCTPTQYSAAHTPA